MSTEPFFVILFGGGVTLWELAAYRRPLHYLREEISRFAKHGFLGGLLGLFVGSGVHHGFDVVDIPIIPPSSSQITVDAPRCSGAGPRITCDFDLVIPDADPAVDAYIPRGGFRVSDESGEYPVTTLMVDQRVIDPQVDGQWRIIGSRRLHISGVFSIPFNAERSKVIHFTLHTEPGKSKQFDLHAAGPE